MADTFEALGRDEQALKDSIAKSPPTLDAGDPLVPVQRPFLDDLTALLEGLRGRHRRAARRAAAAQRRGRGSARRCRSASPTLNERAAQDARALRDLAEAPGTNAALRGLTATVTTLNPQLRFYGPYVTVCNSWNYFWTYLAEHFSEPDTTGSAQRALLNSTGRQEDSLGSMGADEPANGEGVHRGHAAVRAGPAVRRRGRRRRAAPTARPASAASSSARRASSRPAVQDRPRPALARPARARPSRAARACPRARRSPPSRRPAVRRDAEVGAPMRPRAPTSPSGSSRSPWSVVLVYFGFTKAIPFAAPLRGQGRVRELEQHAARLAGADRRRRGRQGHRRRARASAATGAIVTMRIEDKGRPIHSRRDGEDPPADLPRGQLLRRPDGRARRRRPSSRTATTIPVQQTATPVQLDEVLTALQSDTREDLKTLLREYGKALEGDGAQGLQPLDPVLGAGVPRLRDRRRRGARRDRRTTCPATSTSAGATARGARPQPRAAEVAGHRLQHDRRGVRARGRQPARRRRRAAAHAARRAAGARRAQRGVPAAARAGRRAAAGRAELERDARRRAAVRAAAARPRLAARAARPGRRPAADGAATSPR